MKQTLLWIELVLFSLIIAIGTAQAEDMRDARIRAQQVKQEMFRKAAEEKQAAQEEAEQNLARVANDRAALKKAVASLRSGNKQLDQGIKILQKKSHQLLAREKDLAGQLGEMDSVLREVVGLIRVNTKDITGLIEQNPQSALHDREDGFLRAIAGQGKFPGMDDIRRMVDILKEEILESGEVSLQKGLIVNRAGKEIKADILMLGSFTAAYRIDGETGFLNYSPSGRKLFALSRLPDSRIQKQLCLYMDGKGASVPMDISRGGALRRLTHELSLLDQVPKGGPLIWPILAILALGIAIIIERIVFFLRKRLDTDDFIQKINKFASCRQWDECRRICSRYKTKPVARVVAAGLDCRHMGREEIENGLQEAILSEMPAMERFLSTLGMLAAIAPLLGLLGTVTGMIDTFHVMTLFGTGDPRMMSGGISEALVTTMLGLSVAIPIMLAHTLLSRTVDNMIGQMEEKGVAFVNIVHKSRSAL